MTTLELLLALKNKSSIGYFIQCDLEYPKKLHDDPAHVSLPLIPHHHVVNENMLSNFQKKISNNLTDKIGGNKVITSLLDKIKITLHYKNLKQAIKLGMKLKKVHRVLKFKQGRKFKSYVQLCTEQRKKCKNEFEKMYWKLMVNSLYGKMCENMRKRRDVKIVELSDKEILKYTRKLNFKDANIYEKELFMGVELEKDKICFNKPRYVGSTVLNLSKTLLICSFSDISGIPDIQVT